MKNKPLIPLWLEMLPIIAVCIACWGGAILWIVYVIPAVLAP
jgi:hypothetical protein